MSLPDTDPQSFEKRSGRFIAALFVAALFGSVFQINFLVNFHRNWFVMGRVPIDIAGLFATEHHAAAALLAVSSPERMHFIEQQAHDGREQLETRRFDCKSFSPTQDRRARIDAAIELPRNSRPQILPDGDALWIVFQHEVRKIGGPARGERIETEMPRDVGAVSSRGAPRLPPDRTVRNQAGLAGEWQLDHDRNQLVADTAIPTDVGRRWNDGRDVGRDAWNGASPNRS